MSRPSIGWVVTAPSAVKAFVTPYLVALARDHDVTLYVNAADDELASVLPANVELVTIDLRRPIAPLADLRALLALTAAMRRRRHALVHSMLPKSGLLGMTAGWLAGVPHRIHLFTGQVWANKQGLSRQILRAVDRWTANRATLVMADSSSQRDFLISQRVARAVDVIGPGSVCGLDSQRFRPDAQARRQVREALGIGDDARLIGFLGRINRDKGVAVLLDAFKSAGLDDDVHLALFGPDEEGLVSGLDLGPRIHVAGPTDRPEQALAAMDLFCLPSFREGFGVSVLEASSTGLPVVASRIYGLTDAVVEGETGWLVPPGNVAALADALSGALGDRAEMARRGAAGRARVMATFAPDQFVASLLRRYAERLWTEG